MKRKDSLKKTRGSGSTEPALQQKGLELGVAINFRPSISSKFVTVPTNSYCLLASLLTSLRGLASLSIQVCDPQVYYEFCNTGWVGVGWG